MHKQLRTILLIIALMLTGTCQSILQILACVPTGQPSAA